MEDLRTLVAEAEQFLKTGDQDRSYTLGLKTSVVWEQTRDELKKNLGFFDSIFKPNTIELLKNFMIQINKAASNVHFDAGEKKRIEN